MYEKFLEGADKKKDVNEEDLQILVGKKESADEGKIKLVHLQVLCGMSTIPMATVSLSIDGEVFTATQDGNGPVDAALEAVKTLIRHKVRLEEFLIQAITRGIDDLGKVHMQIENRGRLYYGFSGNTDIVTASVEAFIDAVNKIV